MDHHLFMVLGRHPEVFTEALYGLSVKRGIVVNDVHCVTTGWAKQKVTPELLNPVSGAFYRLCREYPEYFENVYFSAEHIQTARFENEEIDDVSDSAQSQAFLNLILQKIIALADNDDSALHCVVGGGRRTLSVYLAMVLQLLARPQDKLYHIVVRPKEAEINSDFYFPTRNSFPMKTYNGKPFDAKDVHVELVEIPFLRLRPRIPNELLASQNYGDILDWLQKDVEASAHPLPLTIDLQNRCISIGAIDISLEPVELAIYSYFAERSFLKPANDAYEGYAAYFEQPNPDGHFSKEVSSRIRVLYEEIVPREEMRQRFLAAFSKDGRLPLDYFRPHFSNIKKKIIAKIPNEDLHRWYVITSIGLRGNTSYGIKLDREFIRLPDARL